MVRSAKNESRITGVEAVMPRNRDIIQHLTPFFRSGLSKRQTDETLCLASIWNATSFPSKTCFGILLWLRVVGTVSLSDTCTKVPSRFVGFICNVEVNQGYCETLLPQIVLACLPASASWPCWHTTESRLLMTFKALAARSWLLLSSGTARPPFHDRHFFEKIPVTGSQCYTSYPFPRHEGGPIRHVPSATSGPMYEKRLIRGLA